MVQTLAFTVVNMESRYNVCNLYGLISIHTTYQHSKIYRIPPKYDITYNYGNPLFDVPKYGDMNTYLDIQHFLYQGLID